MPDIESEVHIRCREKSVDLPRGLDVRADVRVKCAFETELMGDGNGSLHARDSGLPHLVRQGKASITPVSGWIPQEEFRALIGKNRQPATAGNEFGTGVAHSGQILVDRLVIEGKVDRDVTANG